MEFSVNSSRLVAIFFAVFLAIMGVTLVVRGTTLYNYHQSYDGVTEPSWGAIPLAAVIIGGTCLVLFVFGFAAILLNGYGMLMLTVIMLVLTFMSLLGCALVTALLLKSPYRSDSDPGLETNMINAHEAAMDAIQNSFKCCGINASQDYEAGVFTNIKTWLNSCCRNPEKDTCKHGGDVWTEGCFTKMKTFTYLSHLDLAIMCGCFSITIALGAVVLHLHALGVRQEYYY